MQPMPSPLHLDLAERVLRVDLTERISPEQWQTVIDMVGEQAGSDRDLVIVLDGQSSGSGGEAVVDALVDALVVRGIKIRSITPGG
jgi:acyl-CoA synthetase (NDP forming)